MEVNLVSVSQKLTQGRTVISWLINCCKIFHFIQHQVKVHRRCFEKKPSKLSALPQTFTCVQTHYKGHFVKVWGRSVEICVQGNRWPDTQKSCKNGHFRGPRAADPEMPSTFLELPQNFSRVQLHSKASFVKVSGGSVQECVHGNRWPDMTLFVGKKKLCLHHHTRGASFY